MMYDTMMFICYVNTTHTVIVRVSSTVVQVEG